MNRRHVLGSALAAVAGSVFARSEWSSLAAARERLVVVVRQAAGMVAVDPHFGLVTPIPGGATPVADSLNAAPTSDDLPDALQGIVGDGEIDYWMQSPDGSTFIFRRSMTRTASWWWLSDAPKALNDLPADLEVGLPSSSSGRWFHGAVVHPDHLGSGSLRLLAVDMATGDVVLDEMFDRRLELAAIAIGDNGSLVSHVQGGNTHVDVWVADLLDQGTMEATIPIEPRAPAAPSAIELAVARDDNAVVAVGLSWSAAGHPEPIVVIVSWHTGRKPTITTVAGELVGIGPVDV